MAYTELNEIFDKAVGGNAFAENQLFEFLRVRFTTFVKYRIKEKEDIEDIVHNAILVVKDKYRKTEMTSGFSAWAYGVLKNELLRYYRDTNRRRRVLSHDDSNSPQPIQIRSDPGFMMKLHRCLKEVNRINPRYTRVLNLTYQGFGSVEICRRLAISAENLYVMLHRARTALRKCLDRKG